MRTSAGRAARRTRRMTVVAVAAAVALGLNAAPGSAAPRAADPSAPASLEPSAPTGSQPSAPASTPAQFPPSTLTCNPATGGSWGEQKTTFDLAVSGAGSTSLGCTPGTVGNTLAIAAAVTAAPTAGTLTLGGVSLTSTSTSVPTSADKANMVAVGDGNYAITVTVTEVNGTGTVVATLPENITFKAVSPPICFPIQLYGLINDGSNVAQYANNVNLAYDPGTGAGCNSASTSPLTYTITNLYHATLTPDSSDNTTAVRTLVPEVGYVAPQDWLQASQTITFTVRARDSLGQDSVNPLSVAAGVAVSMQVSSPVSATCAVQPEDMTSQTYFNNPTDYNHPDNRFLITQQMIDYINCAGDIAQADFTANGSSNVVIFMSWFSLTDKDVVTALVRAKQRHANVRFLINSHATKSVSSSYTTWTSLRSALGTDAPAAVRDATTPGGSWAMYCDSGCLTPPCIDPTTKANLCKDFPADSEAEYPALHSKFFSILYPAGTDGKQTTVVGIASSNPTREQALRGWNNMQVVVERNASWSSNPLFKSLNTYARDLAGQGLPAIAGGNPTAPTAYRKLSNVGQTSFVVFPRGGTGGSTDNITQFLNGVKCRYTDSNGKLQRTQIYVNMFVFTRNSPAMKLWRLAFNPPRDKATPGGCQVHIIYTDMDSAIRSVTPGSYGKWLTKKGPNIAYGAADCLSAPGTLNGHWRSMLGTSRIVLLNSAGNPVRNSKGKYRYVKAFVCNRGSLHGLMPTINTYNKSLCWLNRSSSVSGGSIDACVATPLKLTVLDPADGRAKLEYWPDADGHYSYSHQKYMLVSGMVDGKIQKVTVSGTPNFTNPGLRWNDEIMTITTGASTYNEYLANWRRMRSYIKGRPGAFSAVTKGSDSSCRVTGTTPCNPAT